MTNDKVTLYRLRQVRGVLGSMSSECEIYDDRDRLISDLFDAMLEVSAHRDLMTGILLSKRARIANRVARIWWQMTGPSKGKAEIDRAISKVYVDEYVDGEWVPLKVTFTEPEMSLDRKTPDEGEQSF